MECGIWEHNRRIALWRRACSLSHAAICNCGRWWSHVKGGSDPGDGGSDAEDIISHEGEDHGGETETEGTSGDIGDLMRYTLKADQKTSKIWLLKDGNSWAAWGVYMPGLKREDILEMPLKAVLKWHIWVN